MISKRIWLTIRRRRSRHGYVGRFERWEVEREGWFLLGLVPLYVRDVRMKEL